ncbi:MAG TPA: GFA family protein [Dongiaceae bacterium]
MLKTFQGGCHCGAVRFECDLDLEKGTSKCNCSICRKGRFWKAIVMADAFRLIQGADALSEYQFGRHMIHHLFCTHCGIKPFGRANVPELGGEFYAVNLACLDVGEEELAAAPVRYEDGKNDNWQSVPSETRHL